MGTQAWTRNTTLNSGFIPKSHHVHNFNSFQWKSEAVAILLVKFIY